MKRKIVFAGIVFALCGAFLCGCGSEGTTKQVGEGEGAALEQVTASDSAEALVAPLEDGETVEGETQAE